MSDIPHSADQFEAHVRATGRRPLLPGRPYRLRIGDRETPASITAIKYREDPHSGARLASRTLVSDQAGVVNLATSQPLSFAPCADGSGLPAAFVLLDAITGEPVAEGSIVFALRRATNIRPHALTLDKARRAERLGQRPRCIWFTGLSGAGKSTIANLLEMRLHAEGRHTYLLDGDNVRRGLSRDLGFTEADRVENVRRVAEVARLMVDAGLVVIVSFISPFRAEREMARSLFAKGEFVEVFVDAPIAVCEERDPKGLYAKARRGELPNFTGIDSPYEAPGSPEVRLDSARLDPQACAQQIIDALR